MNRKEQIFAAAKQQYVNRGYTRLAFTEGAQWADEHPKSPWISVEERLPEPEDEYESEIVIAREGDCVFVGFYAYYSEEWKTLDTNTTLNVTHWMPIPQLPEVE